MFVLIKNIVGIGMIFTAISTIWSIDTYKNEPDRIAKIMNDKYLYIKNSIEPINYKNLNLICKLITTLINKKLKIKYRNKIIKIQKNKYLLEYTFSDQTYLLLLNKKSGPKTFMQVIDDNNNDVTNLINKFAGPGCDFHNSQITPAILGCCELTFNLTNGNSISFEKNDIIKINQL